MSRLLITVIAVWVIVGMTSCANIKNFQYLQGKYDTAAVSRINIPEPLIQKGDLLGITVFSDDPLSTAAVTRQNSAPLPGNNPGLEVTTNSLTNSTNGFLVNQNGQLQLYKLGFVNAAGITKEKLADTLEHMYASLNLLKNPYVEVRFLNYRITVIGEVNKPGPYTIPVDKVNAFEAIGLAGDITVYGRRDNVLVVRESNGVRQFGKLNLKDPNVFLSPYYYLQQNDMVIVDVSKNKSTVNNQNLLQTVSIGATLISVIAIVSSIIDRN